MPRNTFSPFVCPDIRLLEEIAECLCIEKQFRRKNEKARVRGL
jgi:hypothetical protein